MSPLVSIVVPTRNGGERLRDALAAIAGQDTPFSWEIVAVDSGSTDGTVSLLRSCGATLLTVAPEAFNHGTTRNQALAHARGELAVLLVQDAVPIGRRWLSSLVAPLLENPSIAGAFARQQAWPDASRLTAHYLSRWVAFGQRPETRAPLTDSELHALPPADRHIACAFDNVCSCIRMSVWRQHPFRATAIAEDLQWGKDVLTAGHSLAYVPSAAVWHSHERSVRYELQRTYRVHQRLQVLFGLETVPSVPALVRAVCTTLPTHWRLAVSEPRGRARAAVRGTALAVALPLGQYLGARSSREGREWLRTQGV